MVSELIKAKFRAIATVIAATAGFLSANPALANSSSNADIAAPLRTAQAAKAANAGAGDENFRSLFSNWQSLEQGNVPALAAVAEAANQAGLTAAARSAAASRSMATLAVSTAIVPASIMMPRGVSIPSRMPVEGIAFTSGYGMRTHPVLGGRRAHKGVDLAGPVGTPIHATADGVVSTASWFSSYGLYVSLEHGGEIQTRYGHMSRLNVAAGQRVRKGDIIGFIGSTGRSTGPHLHYEVRVHGDAVNPVPYMQADQLVNGIGGMGGN